MRLVIMFITVLLSQQAVAQSAGDTFRAALSRSSTSVPDSSEAASDRWYRDQERGWFWYEEPPIEPEEIDPLKPSMSAPPMSALAELEALQQRIEETKARAVLHPSEASLREWLSLNQQIQNKAELFADTMQRVVWTTPSLDSSLVRPHSQEGLKAWTAARTEARSEAMREIAAEYGLFFVFESDCTYCRQIAPFLQRFARTYDFKIVPISLDGGTLPEFPDARYEPSMRQKLSVEVTPAVYLVNPGMGHIQPIAYGVVSLSELETRIMRLMRMEPGQMNFNVYSNGGQQR
ncbi:MAG: conjugal transfer protein TraF [Pseudomonadota bacterium]